jgi:N-acetylglutamate synthase-like GNAT family acetyltransferase
MADSAAIAEITRLRKEVDMLRRKLSEVQGEPLDFTMSDAPSRIVACAIDIIHSAYWTACENECKAVDPERLGIPAGLLDDAYKAAELVEADVKKRGISWVEARKRL